MRAGIEAGLQELHQRVTTQLFNKAVFIRRVGAVNNYTRTSPGKQDLECPLCF